MKPWGWSRTSGVVELLLLAGAGAVHREEPPRGCFIIVLPVRERNGSLVCEREREIRTEQEIRTREDILGDERGEQPVHLVSKKISGRAMQLSPCFQTISGCARSCLLVSKKFWAARAVFAECPAHGHSANLTAVSCHFVADGSLPSVPLCQVCGTRQTKSLPSVDVCRVSGTRQNIVCRVFCFTECGTRQRLDLPSAQYIALGKDFCSR
jgi:hypothetical protein